MTTFCSLFHFRMVPHANVFYVWRCLRRSGENVYIYVHYFWTRVMPFPQTCPEVCCNLDYFVVLIRVRNNSEINSSWCYEIECLPFATYHCSNQMSSCYRRTRSDNSQSQISNDRRVLGSNQLDWKDAVKTTKRPRSSNAPGRLGKPNSETHNRSSRGSTKVF